MDIGNVNIEYERYIKNVTYKRNLNNKYENKINNKNEEKIESKIDKVNAFISYITERLRFANEHRYEKLKMYTFYRLINYILKIIDNINVKQSQALLQLLHGYEKNKIVKYNRIKSYRKVGSALYNIIYSGKNILSIIIPVYNNELYIDKCLSSILSQSIKNVEIICVDDGSKDNSLKILNHYASKYSFIKVISQENKGSGIARNKALDIASGEFITFMDSDDYFFYSEYLFDCLDYLVREDDVDIVVTPCLRRKNGKLKFDVIKTIEKCTGFKAAQTYLSRNFGTHASWAKFYRRNVLDGVRFIEFGYSQDVMFCANAMRRARNVTALNYYGYVYFNDNVSSWRPKKITTDHVLSSFRLLLETLHWKYENELEIEPIDIYSFIWIWNNDHGKRIETYIKKNGKKDAIHLFFSKIPHATPIMLSFIKSNYIKSFLNSVMIEPFQNVQTKRYDILLHYISRIDAAFQKMTEKRTTV